MNTLLPYVLIPTGNKRTQYYILNLCIQQYIKTK